MIKKFYWVKGQIFENSENRANGKGKAIAYCRENGIDESEIFELSNNSELAYFEELLKRDDIYEIKSHEKVALIGFFTNDNGDNFPPYQFETSFTYKERGTNKTHIVYILNSVYRLTKEFLLSKTLYDYSRKGSGFYLEVYYLDDEGLWKEWKVGDNEIFAQFRKEQRKRYATQKKAIRDRQKYDRLLRLRSIGTITERQSKELYRLEKVFGGNNG